MEKREEGEWDGERGPEADVGGITDPAKDLAFTLNKRGPLGELEQIL